MSRRLPQTVILLYWILGLTLVLGALEVLPGAADWMKLVLDGLWLVLLVYLLRFARDAFSDTLWVLAGWVLTFILITVLTALVQGVKPWLSFWALRNNFRFYTVFLGAGAFLRRQDRESVHRVLEWLFWGNAGVTLVQFFIFGIRGDNLGGILGTGSGVNGSTILFFGVVITHSLLQFLDGAESLSRCFGKCFFALLISAMAELKFFFVLFLLILVLAMGGRGFSWRKFWLALGGLAAALAGAWLLVRLFPRFRGWFSPAWLWRMAVSAAGYTGAGDLNRLNAIGAIDKLFFPRWYQRIFGLGLGACETSSVSLLCSDFFRSHGGLHYHWMSHSFWYLEGGWMGLIFFFGFFFLVFCRAGGGLYGRQSRILALCCLLIGIYNASLRTETAFLMYTVLAFPFAGREENHDPVLRTDPGQQRPGQCEPGDF